MSFSSDGSLSNPMCPCNSMHDTNKIVWKFPKLEPPAIFIDNNPGFVPVDHVATARSSESLSFGNMKYCAGFTFYATDESIGIGIIINGSLFSIVDSTIEDFFNISIDDEDEVTETTILCALQLDFDLVYVAACARYNGGTFFASKTVNTRGLAVSTRTLIEFSSIGDRTKQNYLDAFNEDGTKKSDIDGVTEGTSSGDMMASYEEYNEAHGFSDVRQLSDAVSDQEGSRKELFSVVSSDLNSLTDGQISFSEVVDIISAETENSIFLIGMSESNIKVIKRTDVWENYDEESIYGITCTGTDNIYEGYMFLVPNYDLYSESSYKRIYSPPGVFYRYSGFSKIVILGGDDNHTFSAIIDNNKTDDVDIRVCYDEEKKAIASCGECGSGLDCVKMRYILCGNGIVMNYMVNDESDIIARYQMTGVSIDELGGTTKGVRSMSLYIPYTTQD